MSAQHTPGPWRFHLDGHGGMSIESIEWQVGYASRAGGRQEANARLMSAAPDLLAALIEMEREKSDYMRRNNLGNPAEEHTNKLARAAIAKATGEAA